MLFRPDTWTTCGLRTGWTCASEVEMVVKSDLTDSVRAGPLVRLDFTDSDLPGPASEGD